MQTCHAELDRPCSEFNMLHGVLGPKYPLEGSSSLETFFLVPLLSEYLFFCPSTIPIFRPSIPDKRSIARNSGELLELNCQTFNDSDLDFKDFKAIGDFEVVTVRWAEN